MEVSPLDRFDRALSRSRTSMRHPRRTAALEVLRDRPVRPRSRCGLADRQGPARPLDPVLRPDRRDRQPGHLLRPAAPPGRRGDRGSRARGAPRRPARRVARLRDGGRSPSWWRSPCRSPSCSTAGSCWCTQAAVQSIVVSTLIVSPGGALTRWTDALVGGAVALVAATVVPAAALRRPREQAARVLRKEAEMLRDRRRRDDRRRARTARSTCSPTPAPPTTSSPSCAAPPPRVWPWWRRRRSGCDTSRASGGWPSWSNRSTGRCGAPAS